MFMGFGVLNTFEFSLTLPLGYSASFPCRLPLLRRNCQRALALENEETILVPRKPFGNV